MENDNSKNELKLKKLSRGFVLTNFEGNEVGLSDAFDAINEIGNILGITEEDLLNKYEYKLKKEMSIDKKKIEQVAVHENKPLSENIEQPENKPLSENIAQNENKISENNRPTYDKIYEKAKEQIELSGKYNGAKIARDLEMNTSTVHGYLKRMRPALDSLIKEWFDIHDKPMLNVDTKIDPENKTIETTPNQ